MAGASRKRRHGGWRDLGFFWLAVLILAAAGAGAVQWLGPPAAESREAGLPGDSHLSRPADGAPKTVIAGLRPVAPVVAGRGTPGPVADADPTLLEPADGGSTPGLPRISSDGRSAMQVYAAGFDHSSRRPRIGLVLAGIGPNEEESDAAVRTLPGAVSLAVSPYATNVTRLLATARTAGHEYLIALPLEPTGFPLNDPGPNTLLTSLAAPTNLKNLHWALSRIDGYVGAIGVIGTMRGERLAAMTDQMDAVLVELGDRGLLYIDPRPDRGAVPKAWGRHIDILVDDPSDRDVADRTMIDAKLAELEQLARDTGSALGLVMRPTPVAVARVAAWSNGLTNRGFALAPASAMVLPPSDVPVKLSERE